LIERKLTEGATPVLFLIVIPAKAGLRRQDAVANSEAGPKGAPQERRVIQRLLEQRARQYPPDNAQYSVFE
jgi:hypothetical protein